MVLAPNLQQPHFNFNRDGTFVGSGERRSTNTESHILKDMLRSNLFHHMADDESRASSFIDEVGPSKQMQKERRDDDEVDMGWLQLSLGSHMTSVCSSDPTDAPERRHGLTELDLYPGDHAATAADMLRMTTVRSASPAAHVASTSSMEDGTSMNFRQQLEVAWRSYWHGQWNSIAAASSTPFYSQIPHHQQPYAGVDFLAIDDMRVVDPPLRPPSGLWFALLAAQNPEKETFLPQLPKSYLRVRDGRVTVLVLMKYLSRKLGLNNESQVEITCREQQLQPWMTLQHVRDSIWCSSDDAATLNTQSPAAEHLMILQYSQKA